MVQLGNNRSESEIDKNIGLVKGGTYKKNKKCSAPLTTVEREILSRKKLKDKNKNNINEISKVVKRNKQQSIIEAAQLAEAEAEENNELF